MNWTTSPTLTANRSLYSIRGGQNQFDHAQNQNLVPGAVVITNPEERALGLKLTQLSSVVFRAEADKEPSVISDYAYTLAQLFSSFYNASPIMGAETSEIAASRLALARLTRDVLVKLLYLLGIEAPEAMLKA